MTKSTTILHSRMLPERLPKNAFIIPQYLAVASYGAVAVFGLLQIYLAKDKHRWINFVVSFQLLLPITLLVCKFP